MANLIVYNFFYMNNYLVYVGVALTTVLLPGPAVMLTINNAVRRGLLRSLVGIAGIALAILVIALISASSLGIILASSVVAFTTIKIAGAIYLIFLGVKMWRKKSESLFQDKIQNKSLLKCFMEGFLVSISNPKAVIFFISIFPQFINLSQSYSSQVILLAATFSAIVVVVHTIYALTSAFAKSKFSSINNGQTLNKISGAILVAFGIRLMVSSR